MTSVIWPTLVMPPLPEVLELPDPYDNYLLAITRTGAANYLVSGDKRDLVSLNKHEGTTIVTVGHLLNLHTQKSMSIDAVRQLHGDAHMKHKDKLEVVSGSGNVLEILTRSTRTPISSRRSLRPRLSKPWTGIAAAEFSRFRHADLRRSSAFLRPVAFNCSV